MNTPVLPHAQGVLCELRFQSLFDAGRAYAFPCDASGHVDLDALSDRSRANYLYARTVIGREFAHPAVTALAEH
jgi:hypothetical protein